MQLIKILPLLFTALVALIGNINAAEDSPENDSRFDPKPMIMHHIADSHEWHLWDVEDESGNKKEVSIPLPVILFHEGSLHMFMSSAFDHGKSAVKKGDTEFILYHGSIYVAGEEGGIIKNEKGEVINAAPLDLSITKNVFTMLFSGGLLLLLFGSAAKSYKKNGNAPGGIASFLEPLVVFVRDDIAIPNIGEHKYKRYMSFLLTAFFFIWLNNLLGLVPFFPGGANLTGNIAVTMVLAIFTLLITNFSGNKHYWKHIFATPGVPFYVMPIMVIVEVIGIFTKPFALMIRLFANVTAGHIIILSLISLVFIFETVAMAPVSIAFALFMNVLELLVAALQAYIFTLLSALFIGSAVAEEH